MGTFLKWNTEVEIQNRIKEFRRNNDNTGDFSQNNFLVIINNFTKIRDRPYYLANKQTHK